MQLDVRDARRATGRTQGISALMHLNVEALETGSLSCPVWPRSPTRFQPHHPLQGSKHGLLFSNYRRHGKRRRFEHLPTSHAANTLLHKFGAGKEHSSGMQHMAASIVADGGAPPAVATIAGLGANGNQAQNIERDAHRWLKHLHGLAIDPYTVWFDLQCKAVPDNIACPTPVSVLLLHEVMDAIWRMGPTSFACSFVWG